MTIFLPFALKLFYPKVSIFMRSKLHGRETDSCRQQFVAENLATNVKNTNRRVPAISRKYPDTRTTRFRPNPNTIYTLRRQPFSTAA